MIRLQDWAAIREALYSKTGIDFGLPRTPEEFAAQVRKHAQLIGELADLPADQEFTVYPLPNWSFPSPVEGRTQRRKTRLPGDGMRMRARGQFLEVVKHESMESGVIVCRPEQEGFAFFQKWADDVKKEGTPWQKYSAEVDTGTSLLQLVGVWPWSIRGELIAFRYDRVE